MCTALSFTEDGSFLEHVGALADLTGTAVIVATLGATAFTECTPTPLHTLAALPDGGIAENLIPTVEALAYQQDSKQKRQHLSDG